MNVGISFNTNITRIAFFSGKNSTQKEKTPNVFEFKNYIAVSSGKLFVAEDAVNEFLTEENCDIYHLDEIVEINGLPYGKQQLSVERCLSVIFSNLIDKIKINNKNEKIDAVSIAIPYDKYYYWHAAIEKSFSIIGIKNVRVISEPTAFFCQPHVAFLHGRLNGIDLSKNQQKQFVYKKKKEYQKLPWYKKIFVKKPTINIFKSTNSSYTFISVSQNNTNISFVEYGDGVLETSSTKYVKDFSGNEVRKKIYRYLINLIEKSDDDFDLEHPKTKLRLFTAVEDLLLSSQKSGKYKITIPFVLCKNNKYKTLEKTIDIKDVFNIFSQEIQTLASIKEFSQSDRNILVIGDRLIQEMVSQSLRDHYAADKIIYRDKQSLAIGAIFFSQILIGKKVDFVSLEVIPFSVLVRLSGGEFKEIIKKDSTIPTFSAYHSFKITNDSHSEFAEVHLTTREGSTFQSLSVWRIKLNGKNVFKIKVDISPNSKIALKAVDGSKKDLPVQQRSTFSFGGSGFKIGIKGKNIQQYVLNQFNYLSAASDYPEALIFEPDSKFYKMLKDGEPFTALRYLGVSLKLKSLPDVELSDSSIFKKQGIGAFFSGNKIIISHQLRSDPYVFGYYLAHELSHYLLRFEEKITIEDNQENEILTEIFTVYRGMGKLFLNGFFSENLKLESQRGYLDKKILKYIHQIYLKKFNISVTEYRKNLIPEAAKMIIEEN